MSTETTMTVLASALVDSKLLSALQHPNGLDVDSDLQAAIAGLDTRKLALFAGFITMVRHNNDLFQHLPNTLRVLRHYGVELSVFRDHFLTTGRPVKPLTEKIERALATLHRFADSRSTNRLVGLRDILAHEECHWRIAQDLSNHPSSAAPACDPFSPHALVLKLGSLQVARLMRAPERVIAALDRRLPLRSVPYRPHYRLYVGDLEASTLRIIEVDRRARDILTLVDGRRTCVEILATLVRRGERPNTVRASVMALATAGVIRFANGSAQ